VQSEHYPCVHDLSQRLSYKAMPQPERRRRRNAKEHLTRFVEIVEHFASGSYRQGSTLKVVYLCARTAVGGLCSKIISRALAAEDQRYDPWAEVK
jgi:hypothetical protein